jgi:hypothetical protein
MVAAAAAMYALLATLEGRWMPLGLETGSGPPKRQLEGGGSGGPEAGGGGSGGSGGWRWGVWGVRSLVGWGFGGSGAPPGPPAMWGTTGCQLPPKAGHLRLASKLIFYFSFHLNLALSVLVTSSPCPQPAWKPSRRSGTPAASVRAQQHPQDPTLATAAVALDLCRCACRPLRRQVCLCRCWCED